ncbi:MAG: excinuclease ABC subunit UvrA [Candidatus Saganbacteria bacterium]|nr:excinuclease ABC subunit UvrA [Candidatus Saganbacteria bacterium]
MPSEQNIIIKGARTHNLKNIDVVIPRGKLVVITGLSGSGKSSLAFDTIYAEGQRRYVESLSAYARQFLEQMQKPDVDSIDGLSPSISIEQRSPSRNPRSTVGTITEIYDYLRLLFANIGKPFCPNCGKKIEKQSASQIVDSIFASRAGEKLQILAPVVSGRKGEYRDVFESVSKDGFVRVRVDGKILELEEKIKLDKNRKHNIEIVIDRIKILPENRKRVFDSVETALKFGKGLVGVVNEKGLSQVYSEKFNCPSCGTGLEEISPRIFSFNTPYGACPQCTGLGSSLEFDPDLIIPDKHLSINEGAIAPIKKPSPYYAHQLLALAREYKFSLDTPINKLSKAQLNIVLYGSEEPIHYRYEWKRGFGEYDDVYEGIINLLRRRYTTTQSEHVRFHLHRFMSPVPCTKCKGERLKPESLSIKIQDKNIAQVSAMDVEALTAFIDSLKLTENEKIISRQILKEIKLRLKFLLDVGLNYLSMNRETWTLSGGEAQRTRLATQIGSGLVGVLYILDEPSIGLHQRDNKRLIATLEKLRDLGNTVIVVEHDEEIIRSSDHIIDIGPGAGIHGGKVVVAGSLNKVIHSENSITGDYLSGRSKIDIPRERRAGNGKYLTVKGAKHNNLKDITVDLPLGKFICVTGVSGSGKSSLVNDVLYTALAKKFYRSAAKPGEHEEIKGDENIDKVIIIDQSPIGRTPRSNPATYTKAFDHIRDIFALSSEAKVRGYQKGRFSFNVKGGRCETCGGGGLIKIEMHFLPDVYVRCDECKGMRYNKETLDIRYKGKNIAEVLDMTVEEALQLFDKVPHIKNKLKVLSEVGLNYIHLGQSATTLSGGEAQRVKLSTELSHRSTGKTLYILDEPTTGLHFEDVKKLLEVLGKLTDAGNTVLVIEHNLDVIKVSDYIIDLGPEGGHNGGYIIGKGTPEELAGNRKSFTGHFLKKYFG